MARNQKIKDPKAILSFLSASLTFSAVIVLFIIGSILFSTEHPKVENYDNSICQVDLRSYKTYQCKARYYRYNCYGPIWYVHYGLNNTFAIVETEKRYRYYSDAMDETRRYQVRKSHVKWSMMNLVVRPVNHIHVGMIDEIHRLLNGINRVLV